MPKTMKLTDVGSAEDTVLRYINDPRWIMQQKFDGTRVMVSWNNETGQFHWSNDGEKNLTHAAAKLKVPALEEILAQTMIKIGSRTGNLSLDGELLIRTGEFIVWDILTEGTLDLPWVSRHESLTKFFLILAEDAMGQRLVKPSPTAETVEQKLAMWERVNKMNVEGAVSKERTSPYVPGIRSKQWVKHKLVKTADLVVGDVRRVFKPNSKVVKEGSAQLKVYTGAGHYQSLVSASLIGKDLTIETGDVVEVAYLYREPGGGLVQPRIIRKRWDAKTGEGDKYPSDCTYDQFPEYSRDVVDLELEAAATN